MNDEKKILRTIITTMREQWDAMKPNSPIKLSCLGQKFVDLIKQHKLNPLYRYQSYGDMGKTMFRLGHIDLSHIKSDRSCCGHSIGGDIK